jgi:predicted HicB family RNase H-like nuclease
MPYMKNGDVQLTLRVPERLRDRLNACAAIQRRSANTTALIILENALGIRDAEVAEAEQASA